MVNASFIGRLGGDSEVRTTKGGKQFLHFRVATDDFVNGENVTKWITVMWSGERAAKMKEYLTKGKLVNVRGIYRTDIYTNKNGETQISRDLFADRVDFVSIGSGNTQSNDAVAATGNDFGSLQKPVATAAATTEADDLPF